MGAIPIKHHSPFMCTCSGVFSECGPRAPLRQTTSRNGPPSTKRPGTQLMCTMPTTEARTSNIPEIRSARQPPVLAILLVGADPGECTCCARMGAILTIGHPPDVSFQNCLSFHASAFAEVHIKCATPGSRPVNNRNIMWMPLGAHAERTP